MKTKTSKQSKAIKSLLVLTVAAILLFGFSETKLVKKPIVTQNYVSGYENLKKVTQEENTQPFPKCFSKNQQKGATKEQMKEYNLLAKKYNAMLSKKHFTIQMKDVERLKQLYSLMSKEQKADAEPFPNFPEPPPVPTNPEEVKHKPNGRIITPDTKKFYAGGKDSISSAGFRSPPEVYEVTPPQPPVPPNPLDHIIAMAKQGATFYYKGRKISSNKAIALIKKKPDLSISSENKNGNPPVVKISKNL